MSYFKRVYGTFTRYPILRGMVAYATIWPSSSFVQQSLSKKKTDKYDWWNCVLYGFYGSCYVAPTMFVWIKIATKLFPGNTIRSNLAKVVAEQFSYGPFSVCSFYLGMSILQSKTYEEAVEEVKLKFWPTYKLGVCVWPALIMFNHCFISLNNRVIFVSACSFVWTVFLAYMKNLEKEKISVTKVGK